MVDFLIRSPKDDRESIRIPESMQYLQQILNGSVTDKAGNEFLIRNNILDILSDAEIPFSLSQKKNDFKITAMLQEEYWQQSTLSFFSDHEFSAETEKELLENFGATDFPGLFLDVGCASGLYTRILAKNFPESTFVSVDSSLEMLSEARKRYLNEQIRSFLIRADVCNLPFFSKTFDRIVSGGNLNEFYDAQKALYEFRRVLIEGGKVFIRHLLEADSWYGKLLQKPVQLSGIQFWSSLESNKMFEKAGFKIEKQWIKGIICFTELKTS